MKNKRKRIDTKAFIGEMVIDVDGFVQNKCSEYARRILTILENVEIEIYFDKHYFIRMQHGDENGKRSGIDFESVKKTCN